MQSLALAACVLGGCSLVSDFGSYHFKAKADGGTPDHDAAGQAGSGAGSGAGGTHGLAGSGGQGGGAGASGAGGASGASGASGAGGQGGNGAHDAGVDAGPQCTHDTDCPEATVYQCVNQKCALRRLPSGVWQSGGGGTAKSTVFAARLSIGAPQPMGAATSTHYRVVVGPGAGRP